MCGEIDDDLFHRVFLCDGRIHNTVQDGHVDTEEISFDGDRRSPLSSRGSMVELVLQLLDGSNFIGSSKGSS